MDLLDKLGIDWRLLSAQIVNFLILLFVLYKVLYKPLVRKLEERRGKIEKGLLDADEAHQARARAESEKQVILSEARHEAFEIIQKARAEAEEVKTRLIEEGKAEKLQQITQARVQIESEKSQALRDAQGSISGLVMKLTKKLIGDVLSKDAEKKLNEKTIKEMSSQA